MVFLPHSRGSAPIWAEHHELSVRLFASGGLSVRLIASGGLARTMSARPVCGCDLYCRPPDAADRPT
jgi:hypothetical protein